MSRRTPRLEMSDVASWPNRTGRPVLVDGEPMVTKPTTSQAPSRGESALADQLAAEFEPGAWTPQHRFDAGQPCPECDGSGASWLTEGAKCRPCKGRGVTGRRRWRFDFANLPLRIGVEVHGGTWVNGRHSRGKGFEEDCVKSAAAQAQGWAVVSVTTEMVKDGRAISAIRDVVRQRLKG